jgi:hypothetical protein
LHWDLSGDNAPSTLTWLLGKGSSVRAKAVEQREGRARGFRYRSTETEVLNIGHLL